MTTKDNRTSMHPSISIDPTTSGQDSQPTKDDVKPKAPLSAAPNLPGGQVTTETHGGCVAGDQTTSTDHLTFDSQELDVGAGSNLPPTKADSDSNASASAAPNFPTSQGRYESQWTTAGGDQTPGRHPGIETHGTPASGPNFTNAHMEFDAQERRGVGDQTPQGDQRRSETQPPCVSLGPILASPLLGMAADVVDDLERVRIANENRYRTLTADDEHGHGLSPDHPDVARLLAIVNSMADAEKQAIKNLQKVMKAHPLGPFVKAQAGLGEKQAARLLAVIRDPYWNDLHDRPRTVSELWAYCGFHVLHPAGHFVDGAQMLLAGGVAPKRQRGQKANWSEDARKRVWLIAASCVKQPAERSHYRRVYDATRAKYADAVHAGECVRCGPKGKPAQPGSPLSLGHQHARGLRAVAKEVLRDLWIEAKRQHTTESTEEAAA